MRDNVTNFVLGMLLAIVILVMFGYAMRVTPEDIAKCVDATGWSEERCRVEITR